MNDINVLIKVNSEALPKRSRQEDTQRAAVLRRTAVRPNAELPGIAEPKVERVSLKNHARRL